MYKHTNTYRSFSRAFLDLLSIYLLLIDLLSIDPLSVDLLSIDLLPGILNQHVFQYTVLPVKS